MDMNETLGERIRRLRQEHGLSIRDLAVPEGRVSAGYVSHIENGTRCPTFRTLRVLAAKLDVSPEYLETGQLSAIDEAIRRVRLLKEFVQGRNGASAIYEIAYDRVLFTLHEIRDERKTSGDA